MLPPTFLGFRGRWNITHWTHVSRATWGRGRGTHRGPPARDLVLALAHPSQPLPCDTQESINTLEEKIRGVL